MPSNQLFAPGRTPTLALSLQDIPLKAQEMAGKMSISGVQPKLSLTLNQRTGELVPTATGGTYILKPQTERFAHIPENENCCMDIAEALGIMVPPHGLLALQDGSLAYIVKRFDRKGREKIHQEELYQILGRADKYAGSLEQIGDTLKEISAVPGLDVQLFFERVVFSFLIGNGDGHSKNYAVSYHTDGLRLTPAYDLVCSKLVIPKEADSALTLNGKHDHLTRNDFDAFAERFHIPPKVRYEKFAGQQQRMTTLIQTSKLPAAMQQQFVDIVATRYECLQL